MVIDDSDPERSKNTTQIAKVYKIRDKKRFGFLSGQNIIFLLLITDSPTIPVGFSFYEPDPAILHGRTKIKNSAAERPSFLSLLISLRAKSIRAGDQKGRSCASPLWKPHRFKVPAASRGE